MALGAGWVLHGLRCRRAQRGAHLAHPARRLQTKHVIDMVFEANGYFVPLSDIHEKYPHYQLHEGSQLWSSLVSSQRVEVSHQVRGAAHAGAAPPPPPARPELHPHVVAASV